MLLNVTVYFVLRILLVPIGFCIGSGIKCKIHQVSKIELNLPVSSLGQWWQWLMGSGQVTLPRIPPDPQELSADLP